MRINKYKGISAQVMDNRDVDPRVGRHVHNFLSYTLKREKAKEEKAKNDSTNSST